MGEYPIERNLDGVYFRVKRGEKFKPVCWSDLTDEERDKMGEGRSLEWWRSMTDIMTRQLRFLGDQLDLELVSEEEE